MIVYAQSWLLLLNIFLWLLPLDAALVSNMGNKGKKVWKIIYIHERQREPSLPGIKLEILFLDTFPCLIYDVSSFSLLCSKVSLRKQWHPSQVTGGSIVVHNRTLAFTLSKMRSQWRILSREITLSILFIKWVVLVAQLRMDSRGQGWQQGDQLGGCGINPSWRWWCLRRRWKWQRWEVVRCWIYFEGQPSMVSWQTGCGIWEKERGQGQL